MTFPRTTVSRFVVLAAFIGAVAFLVVMMTVDSAMVGAAAGAVAAYVPFLVLSLKFSKRSKTINEQLPETLDFLARILRAGHSLSTGLQMMGTELPDPLASEFRRCYDQHSLGASLQDCLKDMAARVESTEFSFFVTAVLIQRQTGGDLSTVLGNISAMTWAVSSLATASKIDVSGLLETHRRLLAGTRLAAHAGRIAQLRRVAQRHVHGDPVGSPRPLMRALPLSP